MMRSKWLVGMLALCALLAVPQVSQAVVCGLPSGTVTVDAGTGFGQFYTVSNLAYGNYYLDIETLAGGDFGLFSLDMAAYPGFTQSGTNGFVGTSGNIWISFFVPPSASAGESTQVRARVYNVLGQAVCQRTFTVQVPAFAAPTGFSATYDGEDICFYWNSVPGAERYNLYTQDLGLYRTPTQPHYCRELKQKYIHWAIQVSAYSSVLGEGAKSGWVSWCSLYPSSSYC